MLDGNPLLFTVPGDGTMTIAQEWLDKDGRKDGFQSNWLITAHCRFSMGVIYLIECIDDSLCGVVIGHAENPWQVFVFQK